MKAAKIIVLSCVLVVAVCQVEETLVLVHTIFRHGDRNPDTLNLYPSNPYYNESYYAPYGYGQLTNVGKLKAYRIGTALRERYNGFLDETYNIDLIEPRSSDFNRTKASLQAMLAGLFPPTKDLIWLEGLNWQPISFNYLERQYDKIFRHGERTVDSSTLYPTDPYKDEKYYPYGVGQLTNAGKIREYKIGKALRKRYDNFLGKVYEPDLLDAQSTDFNRTKMSLQLVLAGLFPPIGDQIFETGLYWQPIPYNYLPRNQDKVLLGILCPNYEKFYKRLMKSKRWHREFFERREIFEYLSLNSGWNITNYGDVFYLYFGLRSEKEWGFELPEWTNLVYPQPLEDMVVKEYFVATSTTNLRRLATGYHLSKILDDTKAKIEGTLKPSSRKIFLYSAHESNIANFLTTLDIFEPQIPPYGCYILIEVHQIDGIYGIKIFYQNYIGDGPKLLKLAACEEFCPLDKFASLVEEYLPTDEFCGRD